MNPETITISFNQVQITDCTSAIIVPEIAITEPGYIQMLTANPEAHSKHEFHAMAQMAYYQYQDDELEITTIKEPLTITCRETIEELAAGMLLYRDTNGEFHVLVHEAQNRKKLLESTNRYCTRWVRLDI